MQNIAITAIPAFTAAIASATINRRVRQLLRRFQDAGATNQEHAVTLQALGERHSWIFDRLLGARVFVAVPDGRYYVDEIAFHRRMRQRKVRALVVASIVLVALLALWFSGLVRL